MIRRIVKQVRPSADVPFYDPPPAGYQILARAQIAEGYVAHDFQYPDDLTRLFVLDFDTRENLNAFASQTPVGPGSFQSMRGAYNNENGIVTSVITEEV